MSEKLEKQMGDLSIILLWGALWGIMEATVGALLHMMPFRVPTGSVLFPIGYYFMQKSFRETNDIKSVFYTACVSSFIKFINLFMPIPIIRVLNPAACILFEGAIVMAVLHSINYEKGPIRFIHAMIMSASWRIGYYILCFAIFIPLNMMKSSSILAINKFMEFFVINGLINSILIYGYSKFSSREKSNKKNIRYNPIISTSVFLLALFIQWKL